MDLEWKKRAVENHSKSDAKIPVLGQLLLFFFVNDGKNVLTILPQFTHGPDSMFSMYVPIVVYRERNRDN